MSESSASMSASLVKPEIYSTNLVGMKHRPGAREYLNALPDDCEFVLVPEPTNPYDENAVKVMHEPDDGGLRDLGYVKGVDAERVSKLIADGRIINVTKRTSSKSGSGLDIFYLKGESA